MPFWQCVDYQAVASHQRTGLYRLQELHHSVPVFLGQVVELLGRLVSVALLAVSVPHDGLNLVARAAVVQAVFRARVHARESASPERRCAAP